MTLYLQLFVDFYFGFYICHMRFRVGVGYGDFSWMMQLVMHLLQILPVFLMVCYALPTTTRNISLLFGVLHLQEDAVSDVLQYMEKVGNLRARIKQKIMKIVVGAHKRNKKPDLEEARATLAKLESSDLQVRSSA